MWEFKCNSSKLELIGNSCLLDVSFTEEKICNCFIFPSLEKLLKLEAC